MRAILAACCASAESGTAPNATSAIIVLRLFICSPLVRATSTGNDPSRLIVSVHPERVLWVESYVHRKRTPHCSDAQQDQVNRPAATGDRQVEAPYRRVRLNAWLGVRFKMNAVAAVRRAIFGHAPRNYTVQ
jgi:hypothetical protein